MFQGLKLLFEACVITVNCQNPSLIIGENHAFWISALRFQIGPKIDVELLILENLHLMKNCAQSWQFLEIPVLTQFLRRDSISLMKCWKCWLDRAHLYDCEEALYEFPPGGVEFPLPQTYNHFCH